MSGTFCANRPQGQFLAKGTGHSPTARWRHFALLIVFASVVRGGVLLATHEQLSADPDAYRRIARCLVVHGSFGLQSVDPAAGEASFSPTGYRPPLYPWLLSWLCDSHGHAANVSIALLHFTLGLATVAISYWLGARLLSPLAGIVAGVLVAIDPLLLQSASLVMTETLAATLVAVALVLWVKLMDALSSNAVMRTFAIAVLLGGVLAAAYLCRPTFILWPVMLCIYLLLLAVKRRSARPLVAALIFTVVVGSVVVAWTCRNIAQLGHPVWATTHGGYTLLLGNNPPIFDYFDGNRKFGDAWDATFFLDRWDERRRADPRRASFWEAEIGKLPVWPDSDRLRLDEIADDRLAYESAMAAIQRDRGSFLRAVAWRIGRLHSPLPLRLATSQHRGWLRVMSVTAYYLVVHTLILVGLWRIRREFLWPRWAAWFALWCVLVSVHAFYWTDMRMRAPAVPGLAILASAAVGLRRLRSDDLALLQSTIPAAIR